MLVNVLVGPMGSVVQTAEPIGLTQVQGMLSAISDPTRMAILSRLRECDHCVCHLVEDLGLKQSVVSHHIGTLRRAGLVRSFPHHSDRRWLYYQLDRSAFARLADHVAWLMDDADYNPEPLPCGADERYADVEAEPEARSESRKR